MALCTERGITQTWATRRKAFATTVTSAITTRFAITAKAWLVAKLAAGLAIATATCRRSLCTFLTRAVITAHGYHGAWCGFGFSNGCVFCRRFFDHCFSSVLRR